LSAKNAATIDTAPADACPFPTSRKLPSASAGLYFPQREGIAMAKPLGPKSSLIRDAIKANPKVGNTELAKMINSSPARKEDRIRVEPNDIAKQRQALKKAKPSANQAGSKNGRRKANGRKGGRPRAAATASAQGRTAAKGAAAGGPVDLLDRVFGLAQE